MKPITLLTPREAAAFLKLSPNTLATWRSKGGGPAFVRAGRRIRYSQESLTAFVAARTVPGVVVGRLIGTA